MMKWRNRRSNTKGILIAATLLLGIPSFCFAANPIIPKYETAQNLPATINLLASGVLLGLLAYTIFLALSTKERMFIYFSIIMILLSILQTFASYDKFLFELTYNRVTIITHLLFITFFLFFEDFFALALHQQRIFRINRVSIVVILAYTILFLSLKALLPQAGTLHTILNFFRELFVFYTNALFLTTIIIAMAWMRVEATILLIAFIPPALLTSINAMNIFPFMYRYEHLVGWLMQYNQPIGLSLQAILFSLAMGNRYNQIKLERQESAMESERLRKLDAEKTEFFMNMSHELRTPLTIILGMTRQLREGYFGETINRHNSIFGLIEKNSLRLLKQVSQILKLGNPNRPKAKELIPIDVFNQAIVQEFKNLAQVKHINITYEPAEKTLGNSLFIAPEDLETLMMNLLSNALKYTPDGGSISIQSKNLDDGRLSITVTDTGPGIESGRRAHIFERYYSMQGNSHESHTGIGLFLVKNIMETYGGSVSLVTELGAGSSFILTFPASICHKVPQEETQLFRPTSPDIPLYTADVDYNHDDSLLSEIQSPLDEKAPVVLVVEDNPDMRLYIKSVLSQFYHVITADSGEMALDRLAQQYVDLIVCDVMMPGMDGHDFLYQFREKFNDNPIPLIFLTARDSMEEMIDSLKQGAIRYITKPFSPAVLISEISTILSHDKELVSTRIEKIRQGMDSLLKQMESPSLKDSDAISTSNLNRFCDSHGLSQRERQVLQLILNGKSDKEIAVELNISSRTVANHNSSVYRKTKVNSRMELIAKLHATD
jgi:signal transduction histidine kinase/DNA-binding NarL/FixJ family response regulator